MNNRNPTIDIAKAIGILLMILGHCDGLPYLLRNFIFSFHMPLFLILSGYFYKEKNIRDIISSGNKHLVKPYFITSFFCILLCVTAEDYGLAKTKVIGTIMSNGGWPEEIFGANLPFIGPIWFLLALFWCKVFYAYLKLKSEKCLFYSFFISTIAFIIGKYVTNFPLGILTGFCAIVFYSIGDYWKNRIGESLKSPYFIGGLIIWAFCILRAHLELATFDCSLYPISMLASFIGTYTIFLISKKVPFCLHPFFCWIGQNTLLILCYHTLSTYIFLNMNHFVFEPNEIVINGITFSIIKSLFSLGLPYLHTLIRKQIS